ncbi:protealysin inhibitor emfourin [Leptolyngbya sp. FACHB-36]|uniref:protealysin inhibitor emfourin n=1 Tax=Leptolyngbya sp. FACHB-36 TaxID=2692808 RepID=UPI0018F04989|nr:protealysin inhibitor emfourin [Leptolyngbya sp. FACHB-36]
MQIRSRRSVIFLIGAALLGVVGIGKRYADVNAKECSRMQVSFERSGGFAGMLMTTTVDTASLPSEQSAQLRRLVDAADFFRLPATIPSGAQPDRFQYQITVEEDGRRHSVTVGEAAMPGTMRPLVEWLMEAVRRK